MPAKDQQGKAPTGLRMIVQKRMMDDVLHNTMSKSMGLPAAIFPAVVSGPPVSRFVFHSCDEDDLVLFIHV